MERSSPDTPAGFSSGFTLVELMISMTLGLSLIALMVGTIDKVVHASRVSSEAAETLERGYFLMDAMDTWVSGTSPISNDMLSEVSAEHSAPMSLEHARGVSISVRPPILHRYHSRLQVLLCSSLTRGLAFLSVI